MLNNKLAKAVRLAIAFGGASTAVFAANVSAAEEQKAVEEVERIEVTGSAIKRTDMEGSLPLDVITADDIKKTGVTNVPDLIAALPSMQGFTAAGESVGGSGGGTSTASLRDLGEEYTLVLLNGRRMASSDSGGTIDLNAIPLSAIKRVEILKDGASALYGSDAIAGVVNFILNDDVTDTTVSARFDKPKDTSSANFSVTTGFGDLGSDGFNIMAAYSYDKQDNLRSVDRDFAKTGFINFSHAGQDLVAIAGSSNAIPGNAYVTYNVRDENGDFVLTESGKIKTATYSVNPYRELNGDCHVTSAPSGNACQFDYTSTLEIQPESERNNLLVQGIATIGDDHEAYGMLAWSNFELISRIAPYPTGLIPFELDSAIIQDNVLPHLPDYVANDMTKVAARWRVLPGGNRTTEWNTDTVNLVTGIRGEIADWSYDFAMTNSKAKREENRLTGYPLEEEFMALASSGAINIFQSPEDMSDEQNQMVADTMYNGNWETTDTSLFAVDGKISGEIFELDSGSVYLGTGFDYRKSTYERSISAANRAAVILFESPTDEYDLERDTYGAFVEVIVPVLDNLEVTGSLRYDNLGAVSSNGSDVNKSDSDVTYKVHATYRPNDELLIRASTGTGFKAPSMRQIADPRIEFGVTSVAYDCPAGLSAEKRQYCYSDKLQYDVYREGNPDLKNETSDQYSVGFVWSGDTGTSFSMDYWNIEMSNQVLRLTQNQIFANADIYDHLFVTRTDNGTGDTVLAILQRADNVGKSNTSGIDWAFDFTNDFSFGELKTSVQGTYMIEAENLKVGTENEWETSMGQVGPDGEVTFRNIIAINNSLTHGDFTHSLNVKARSGYQDAPASDSFYVAQADDWTQGVDGSLIMKEVGTYFTVDYRLAYAFDNANVSFGIKNLLDKDAPFTLNGDAGHQVGYDPRYSDAYGRTFYIAADYTF
jgi:iron complex outermembrane receptor protein